MGKKYYCDFCDKSFADNPTNRKNHFRGVHHRQTRNIHYDQFKGTLLKLDCFGCIVVNYSGP